MAKSLEVTTKTLEETPTRALNFLMGVSSSAGIFNLLNMHGYNVDEQTRGWKLLEEAGALRFKEQQLDGRTAASRALGELDNEDERIFRLVRASLEFEFPDQAAIVLEGLSAAQGPLVVMHMAKLLERLDALDSSSKEHDKKAMAKLAVRGLPKAERERLMTLVTQARALPTLEANATPDAELKKRSQEALMRLRAWHLEWSEIARAAISRRDYLIRLGLAARRQEAAEEEPADGT